MDVTGLKPATLYAMMAEGTFPKSIPLGPRIRAWSESEILAWQDGCLAEREAAAK
jgi:prophage regulatory protein